MNLCYTIFHIDDEKNFYRKNNVESIKRVIDSKLDYLETKTYKISNKEELDLYYSNNNVFNLKTHLKFGEIGCIASNYHAWKDFLNSEYDALIIIEDDATLKDNFIENFNAYFNDVPEDFDIVSLYVHPGKHIKYDADINDFNTSSICNFYQNQSTLSYMISRSGAEKYIKSIEEGIDNPLDLFIYDSNKDYNIYSLKPEFDNLFATNTLDEYGEVIRSFTNIQNTDYVDQIKTNKIKFGSLWVGGQLSLLQKICLASFVYYGHEIFLYVYDQNIEVPNGVIKKDASEIVDSSEIFLVENTYAAFSDLFRYRMIKKTGLVWVDADTICLSWDWNFRDNIFASVETGDHGSFVVGGVLGLPQDSEVIDYLIEESTNYDKSNMVWSEIGPELVDKAFKKFNLMEYVYPQEMFCGISINDFSYLWSPDKINDIKDLFSKSKSISAYNQMATRNNYDKNNFLEGSALDYFYNKFIGHGNE